MGKFIYPLHPLVLAMAIDLVTMIAMLGVILGVLWRAIFPYLKAKAEAEKMGIPVKFEIKYLYSTIISLVVTVVVVMMAVESFLIPDTTQGLLTLFMAGFVYGLAFHSAANKVVEAMLA